jgi:glycosyltransferase involved in cell wall biosynthesis
MVTFEQEEYVEQALRSALTQDLDDIEVVVGDDASSDRTLEIVRDWARRDPRVRVLPAGEVLGQRANYMRTLAECRGRYICQLDGDDYWTDPGKLRMQADLLDAEPDCALCFTASQDVDESGKPLGDVFRPPKRQPRYKIDHFAVVNLAHSCAMMWRRGVFGPMPEWFEDAPVGDWTMHLLHAEHGDIAYIDVNMAAHRVHPRGIWAGKDLLARVRTNLDCHAWFLTHLQPSTAERIRPAILHYQLQLARFHERKGQYAPSREILSWLRAQVRAGSPAPARRLWLDSARVAIKALLR